MGRREFAVKAAVGAYPYELSAARTQSTVANDSFTRNADEITVIRI